MLAAADVSCSPLAAATDRGCQGVGVLKYCCTCISSIALCPSDMLQTGCEEINVYISTDTSQIH